MNSSITKKKVVKRLDFENCEITTVKLKKKFRRIQKAKITNEFAGCVSESSDQSQNNSPPIRLNTNENSPILFRRDSAKKRTSKIPSPLLITKKTSKKSGISENFKRFKSDNQSLPSTSSSPVLLYKRCGNKKKKLFKEDSEQKDITASGFGVTIEESPDSKRLTQIQTFSSPNFCPEVLIDDNDEKDLMGDYKCDIEEFTPQELSKDVKILSFSSDGRAISDVTSEEQSLQEDDALFFKTPEKQETEAEEPALDSGRKRKRHKKGGLVAKLINLRQRQASERRIREHTKKIMKAEEKWKKTLQVTDSWIDGSKLLLKCQELLMAQEVLQDIKGNIFILLNKDLGNFIWKIKKGTLLRIAPPWQELRVLKVNIILNVTTLELINEVSGFLVAKTEMLKIPISRYEEDEDFLLSALFDLEHNVCMTDIFT